MRIITVFFLLSYTCCFSQELTNWRSLTSDYLLIDYIEYEVYKVLEFNPGQRDSTISNSVNISHSNSNTKATILNLDSLIESPLIILNSHPVRINLLRSTTLDDIESIYIIDKEKAPQRFGTNAMFGVIIISIDKKAFRRLKKEIL